MSKVPLRFIKRGNSFRTIILSCVAKTIVGWFNYKFGSPTPGLNVCLDNFLLYCFTDLCSSTLCYGFQKHIGPRTPLFFSLVSSSCR